MKNPTKIVLSSALYGLVLVSPLHAQIALEEIVVTAQKRAESLQDVPIAITAFTGETLETLGVTNASDLVNITPGLASGAQSGSNLNYFLRGVGINDFHLTAAPAVGQYFDGITLTSGFHARTALFDMERVEVLKGPQNTLFGLNTTGGAVNYISVKPELGEDTNGSLSLKVGNLSTVNTEGALSFSINDTLAARLAFQTNKQDGAFESLINGTDYGDDDTQAYRATFLWQPSDVATFTFNAHGSRSDNNGGAVRALGTLSPDGSGALCDELDLGVPDFSSNTNCISRSTPVLGLSGGDPSTGDFTTVNQTFGVETVDTDGFYGKLDYDLGWAVLTSVTSFDNLDLLSATESDSNPALGISLVQEDDRDTFQQEVRLVSTGDGPYRWIAGVYYLDEDSESYTLAHSPGIGGGGRLANVQLDHTKENIGAYYQGEYDLSERFTITAGIRYSDEEIIADYRPSAPATVAADIDLIRTSSDIDALVASQFVGTPGFDSNGFEIVRQVRQVLPNEDVGYTVKLDWKVSDDSLVYLSHSKGFKGGAADIRAAFALVPAANILVGLEDARLDPESLLATELGYKGSLFNNSIQFDAAIFYYDYTDLQQFVTASGIPTLDNAPESEIIGFDGSIKYANDSGFYLDIGLSLLDTEVTDATDSAFIQGAELASAPDLSYSILASQSFDFNNGNSLRLTANLNYTAENIKTTLTGGNNLIANSLTQASYTTLNANASYRFGADQQYQIAVFGNNLTDENYCGNVTVNDGNQLVNGATPRGLNNTLTCRTSNDSVRTYGASFSVDF